jgi:hemerythrin-like domain-containing protein
MNSAAETPVALGTRLLAEHTRLDSVFEQLLCSFDGGDATTCQRAWSEFEGSLLGHLEYEEAFLLPKLEQTYPLESQELRQQHATLRKLVAEFGVQVDLHALNAETVRQMVAFLRAHAAREEALLYPWASQLPADLAPRVGNGSAQLGRPADETSSAPPR